MLNNVVSNLELETSLSEVSQPRLRAVPVNGLNAANEASFEERRERRLRRQRRNASGGYRSGKGWSVGMW